MCIYIIIIIIINIIIIIIIAPQGAQPERGMGRLCFLSCHHLLNKLLLVVV